MKHNPNIKETVQPPIRPTYNEWVRSLGISQAAYELSEGKARADELMRDVGLPEEHSVLDELRNGLKALLKG